jgi:hypothetical protein
MKISIDIEEMTERQVKDILENLIEQLDDLDSDDYFGSEGWKHFFGFED